MEDAKAAALKMLSQRSHSRKELKLKLSEKGHPMTAIIGALDRLQHVGLQSDREFAEIFARSKWRQTKWGPGKIRSVCVCNLFKAESGVVSRDLTANAISLVE